MPKLTEAHVSLGNLRKMSVRLATQVDFVLAKACCVFILCSYSWKRYNVFFYSSSAVGQLAIGLHMYREANVAGVEESEGTDTFTRMLNDASDVLNTKPPYQGISTANTTCPPQKKKYSLIFVSLQYNYQSSYWLCMQLSKMDAVMQTCPSFSYT